jgi:hypothetical protein
LVNDLDMGIYSGVGAHQALGGGLNTAGRRSLNDVLVIALKRGSHADNDFDEGVAFDAHKRCVSA